MTKKILFVDETHLYLPERLTALGFECDFQFQTPKSAIAETLHHYYGLVCKSRFSIDRDWILRGTNLRFIARAGVGVEHIDVAFAERCGISVLTSPEGSRDTVAEHTVALLLGVMNNLMRADRQIRAGRWIRKPNTGVELQGKVVGILGYGNMGQAFARRLLGFGCRVMAYDKYKVDYGDQYAEAASLEKLWADSDILSIHIPYSAENHYFVDGNFIRKFHKNIWLLNTARGAVLHTAELVELLQRGKVKGAALDVLEYEEGSFEKFEIDPTNVVLQMLLEADNVVLTPHIAGWSEESHLGHARVLAEKIEKLMREISLL